MAIEKCVDCIKKAIVAKNKMFQENRLTWGEDLELSKILEKICSYAGVNVNEIAAFAEALHNA